MRKHRAKRLLNMLLSVAVSCTLFVFTGCGQDSSGGKWEMPGSKTYTYEVGPDGDVIVIKDYSSIDGLMLDIPPGALDRKTTITITSYVDTPALPDGLEKNYFPELELDCAEPFQKPVLLKFPVLRDNIDDENMLSAFYWNVDTGNWQLVVPESVDDGNGLLIVKTDHFSYWTWGNINLDDISSENLIGAMKEKYGEQTWDSVIGGIIEAIDILETLYVDRTCPTWTRVRDEELPDLIQIKKDLLVSYQSQIAQCGTCNLFSLDFGLDLSKYLLAKTVILTSDLWDLFFGQWAGFMPFLGNVEFGIAMERFIAISFIENQICDYACVTKELGLSVYSTYAIHHVYMITHYMVSLAIDNDFWVACP
jgi:hypothetical protein